MKKIVIVDVDGTISKVGDRIKYLQGDPKDWDSFYESCDEDLPVNPICDLVYALSEEYEIVFCTGRRESVRGKTIQWITDYVAPRFAGSRLLMRKDGDFRHDVIIKPELLKEAGITLEQVYMVLEDRNSMVKKWREMGFTCLQVADGDF